MQIEYHVQPDGGRTLTIDCEDMVPGLETKPWIDGWMRAMRHLMPEDPPGTTTMVTNNIAVQECVDGGLVHDFKGQPICPECGFPGLQTDQRTIVLPLDREQREMPPVRGGILIPIWSEDLAAMIKDARYHIAEEGATVAFRRIVDNAERQLMDRAAVVSDPAT